MTVRADAVLAEHPLDLSAEYAGFVQALKTEGAVVTFAGLARPRDRDGAQVERLFLDHHPRLTQRSLEAIAGDAAARFDVTAVRVVHRCGEVAPGEAIVFVAAASAHRRAAFGAADYLMDRLKTEALFWKREDAANSSRWIEPTADDRSDAARWEA